MLTLYIPIYLYPAFSGMYSYKLKYLSHHIFIFLKRVEVSASIRGMIQLASPVEMITAETFAIT